MNALAKVQSTALAAPLQFTKDQSQMIRDTYANGASETEFAILMEIAKARNLNPLLRQIHFVQRWDNQKGRKVWSAQISIDGIRAIADRTGEYDGQDEPENEYAPDGKLVAVKLRVYRKGIPRPFVGVARWSEYVQISKEGSPTRFWSTMPHTMLAKCAEALAIRKAFPEDAGGIYVAEEMMQAENEPALPRISPHMDAPEFVASADSAAVFEELSGRLAMIENSIPGAKSYGDTLILRDLLGSKAKQSQLTKDIQAAGERNALDAEQRRGLGRTWQRCARQLEKMEKQFPPPDASESFLDAEPEEAAQ